MGPLERPRFLSDFFVFEGVVKSLNEFWGPRIPGVVNQVVGLVNFMKNPNIRAFLRMALYETQEVVL